MKKNMLQDAANDLCAKIGSYGSDWVVIVFRKAQPVGIEAFESRHVLQCYFVSSQDIDSVACDTRFELIPEFNDIVFYLFPFIRPIGLTFKLSGYADKELTTI